MKKTYKMTHYTATSIGRGRYTLSADPGWVLQNGNMTVTNVETADLRRWKAVAAPQVEQPQEAVVARKRKPRKAKSSNK